MANNLKLELRSRLDKNKRKYYIAKLEGPFLIDCKDGVVFLVYTSDEDNEELQIAQMDDKGDY
jgi:hypothetical protein